jgi:hypothetical protein
MLTLQGSVLMSNWEFLLAANPSTRQDNPVSLPRAVPLSLTQSGLFESGAFNASPTPGNRTDELFIFDNTLTGIDRTATKIYYYGNGAWRRLGAGTADVGGDLVFSPNVGVIIRKILGRAWLLLNAPPVNQPPIVDEGVDQTITLPSSANLVGSVSDDGLPMPPGAVTVSWTQINGPGAVTFANPDLQSTSASFSAAGTYVLELKANDGALVSSADITITVNPEPNILRL